MNKIKSYVPESVFFENKDQAGCRIFHDDCAIISTSYRYPLIASRGFDIPLGEPFFKSLAIPDEEVRRIQNSIPAKDDPILIPDQKSTLLIFTSLSKNTGVLLVVRVAYCIQEVQKTIEFARCNAFSPIFHPDNLRFPQEPDLQQKLSEIFYYTDRILYPPQNIGIWTRLLLIANFVGCRLDRISLPPSLPEMQTKQQDVLTAFLLCTFLILRHHTGKNNVTAQTNAQFFESFIPTAPTNAHFFESCIPTAPTENVGKVQVDSAPSFSLYLQHLPIRNYKNSLPKDELELIDRERSPLNSILSMPCFSGIQQTIQNGKLIFEIPLSQNHTLNAHSWSLCSHGIVIIIDPSVHNC